MSSPSPDLEGAIQDFVSLLGSHRVQTGGEAVHRREAATFHTEQRLAGIIQPVSTAEVQSILGIANARLVPVYPVSRGRNWGLGSAVPPHGGCFLMDLAGMNQITGFDENNACLTVEPGVTFEQAHRFLEERGARLMLSCTGGPKDGSVLGNALERGDGVGPYGNRFETICNLLLVLPNGELLRTGPGRYGENAALARLTRDVIGPAFEGLFAQSNLAVVTEATVWLMPKPACHRALQFRIDDPALRPGFTDAMKRLLQEGVIAPFSAGIWNSYKLLMTHRRYPWTMTRQAVPFRLSDFAAPEPWFVSVLTYAPDEDIRSAIERHVRRTLGPFGRELAPSDEDTPRGIDQGVPGNQNIRSIYWRKKREPLGEPDPVRDRCGVIWLCPCLPFDGAELVRIFAELETMIHARGFEPNLGVNCASPRSLHGFIQLVYDREIAGEDQRAMDCHHELFQHLGRQGIYPFRLGTQSMDLLPPPRDATGSLWTALKHHLDPNRILAPGRYELFR